MFKLSEAPGLKDANAQRELENPTARQDTINPALSVWIDRIFRPRSNAPALERKLNILRVLTYAYKV